MLVLTDAHTPPHSRSSSAASPTGSHQTRLPPSPETKTTSKDSLTLSPASVYHTSPSTPRRPLQCRLCFGPHMVCQLVPEADRKRLVQVQKKNFQARQAERQNWSPRSRDIQSSATGITTSRVFSTEKKPLSTDTIVGPVTPAPKSKRNSGTPRGHTLLSAFIKLALPNPEPEKRANSGYTQRIRD